MASEGIDVSKVVRLIMENPHLIEEISNLANGNSEGGNVPAENEKAEDEHRSVIKEKDAPPAPSITSGSKNNRTTLLYALKPYVSKERGRAIDSIITIADVFEGMKRR